MVPSLRRVVILYDVHSYVRSRPLPSHRPPSLNGVDVEASASFAKTHFGYVEDMSAEGSVSLKPPCRRKQSHLPLHRPGNLHAARDRAIALGVAGGLGT